MPSVRMPRKQGPKKKDAPPPADRDAPAEADVDAHPFKPGSWLVVAWPPDGSERLATVIDRARVESDDRDAPDQHHVRKDDLQRRDAARWRYYVHYADFNRRMDEWVRPARVVLPPRACTCARNASSTPTAWAARAPSTCAPSGAGSSTR